MAVAATGNDEYASAACPSWGTERKQSEQTKMDLNDLYAKPNKVKTLKDEEGKAGDHPDYSVPTKRHGGTKERGSTVIEENELDEGLGTELSKSGIRNQLQTVLKENELDVGEQSTDNKGKDEPELVNNMQEEQVFMVDNELYSSTSSLDEK